MSDPVPTTCMRCAVGCGHVHQGADIGAGVAIARGDPAHPTNEGLACGRGIRESTNPEGEWPTRPLVRRDGELVPTTWDIALGEIVAELRERVETAPDSVAVLGSGQQTNEAAYALGKLARGLMERHRPQSSCSPVSALGGIQTATKRSLMSQACRCTGRW